MTAPPETTTTSVQRKPSALIRRGAIAGIGASLCTTALAAIAHAAGVSLQVGGETIPVPAFTMWTIVGAALGIGLARLLRRRNRFLIVTTAATALSLVPPVILPDDVATKLVLVLAHLLAAAIIIPALSQSLPLRQGQH